MMLKKAEVIKPIIRSLGYVIKPGTTSLVIP